MTAIRTPTAQIRRRWHVIAAGARSRSVATLFGARVSVEAGYEWSVTAPDPDRVAATALQAVEDHVVVSPLPGRVRFTAGMQVGGSPSAAPSSQALVQLRAGRGMAAARPARAARGYGVASSR